MDRREFLIGGIIAVTAAACSTTQLTMAPENTTPLLTLLRRDGYSIVEKKNSEDGILLVINGQLLHIKIGPALIGIGSGNGPLNFNVSQYPVPDALGYVLQP